MAPRPHKSKELRPEEIIQQALRLLDKEGPDGLSFRKIAAHFDVTPMAIAHHVGTRDELMRALVDLVFNDESLRLTRRKRASHFFAILRPYVETCLAHPHLLPPLLSNPDLMNSSLKKLTGQVHDVVARCERGIRARTVTHLVIDYTHGFAVAAAANVAAGNHDQPSMREFRRGLRWIEGALN